MDKFIYKFWSIREERLHEEMLSMCSDFLIRLYFYENGLFKKCKEQGWMIGVANCRPILTEPISSGTEHNSTSVN